MWTDDLTVGIGEIDSQHRELFARLERLLDACMSGGEEEEVCRMLDFLGEYVVVHFETEERLQRDHGYPGYENHRAEHNLLRSRIARFRDELALGGPTRDFVLRVNQLLIDWLKTHIREVDRTTCDFLLKKMPVGADTLQ